MIDKRLLYPLREVIKQIPPYGHDLLECGHDLPEASDIHGTIPGRKKRRCHYCWKALTEEERQSLIKRAEDRARTRKDQKDKEFREYAHNLHVKRQGLGNEKVR